MDFRVRIVLILRAFEGGRSNEQAYKVIIEAMRKESLGRKQSVEQKGSAQDQGAGTGSAP